jgi:hypothetical protein
MFLAIAGRFSLVNVCSYCWIFLVILGGSSSKRWMSVLIVGCFSVVIVGFIPSYCWMFLVIVDVSSSS